MKLTKEQIQDQLKKWRLELDGYSSKVSVGYSTSGIQSALENLEKLSAYSARLDEIRSQFYSIDASLKAKLFEERSKLKDAVGQVRLTNIRKWVACGYSSEERGLSASSDVSVLDLKISVRSLELLMFFTDSFRIILDGKIISLSKSKFDCKVVKDILEMGIKLGELK
ncbi:MAG TPA: hypothetical protein ENI23_10885 [bacterium]|nr:hypothetical protein [bacterium]